MALLFMLRICHQLFFRLFMLQLCITDMFDVGIHGIHADRRFLILSTINWLRKRLDFYLTSNMQSTVFNWLFCKPICGEI